MSIYQSDPGAPPVQIVTFQHLRSARRNGLPIPTIGPVPPSARRPASGTEEAER